MNTEGKDQLTQASHGSLPKTSLKTLYGSKSNVCGQDTSDSEEAEQS